MLKLKVALVLALVVISICCGCGSKQHDLTMAARNNDVASVARLLKQEPQLVNGQESGGDTPLTASASCGCVESAKLLIDAGANVDTCNAKHQSPLALALLCPESGGAAVAVILLQHQARVPTDLPARSREHLRSIQRELLAKRLKKEAEERTAARERQREEALRKSRAEAESAFSTLNVESFGVNRYFYNNTKETQCPPGAVLYLNAEVHNMSSQPITGLRLKIEPWGKYFDIGDASSYGSSDRAAASQRFAEMGRFGVLLCGRDKKSLLPFADKYYQSDAAVWHSQDTCFSLRLKPSVAPGQDISITGYLIYKGQRKEIGVLTIHVTHDG